MAETVDLDEWELLSPNSSCKDEFEEADITYIDYFSKDLERRGEISDAEKSVKFDSDEIGIHALGDVSDENLSKLSRDLDSETLIAYGKKGLGVVTDSDRDCSNLAMGFDEKDANFVIDDPVEEFVCSVDCDREDSTGELGFGEMEVLNEFCSYQMDGGIVTYEKSSLTTENFSDNKGSSVFASEGTDNSDLISSNESSCEKHVRECTKPILTKARKEKGGYFEMEMGLEIEMSNGDCSKGLSGKISVTDSSNCYSLKLDKDPKEDRTCFDENENKRNNCEEEMANLKNLGTEANKEKDMMGKQIIKPQSREKGEKVVLAWWKMPIEVIKYCIFGVRPVWSISMAMGFLGFLMFSRSFYLYKTKQKDSKTRPPTKVRFDEKKRAVLQTRAARLNKAVSLIRPDPILQTSFPTFGVTPFPAMSSFQWAP